MSDSPEEAPLSWSADADPDGFSLDDFTPKDAVLELLLDFIIGLDDESESGHIGLVVQSNGVSISGLAISRRQYLTLLTDLVRPQWGDEPTSIFSNVIEENVQAARATRARRENAGLPNPRRTYLHMKDARIFSGRDRLGVPVWRGLLSDITGWSPGTFGEAERES